MTIIPLSSDGHQGISVRHWSVRISTVGVLVALSACSSSAPSSSPVGACPVAARRIVVSVDQWRELVTRLAGDCARVTTVLTTTADPHDFEPTPSDIARLSDADLLVKNGLGYDAWTDQSLAVLDHRPTVVDVGRTVGLRPGAANPHRWYRPSDVHLVATAITNELSRRDPLARTYFRNRLTRWNASLRQYDATVAELKLKYSGRRFAATEGVFDLMAESLGLLNRTPRGYQRAASNESEPGPADLAEFESRLREGGIDVLIDNSQTQGAIPKRLRQVATRAGVPVVEVTESQPARSARFATWQLDQLARLDEALVK